MILRIQTKLATPAEVEKYFNKARSEEAYYTENQEFNGMWGGKAAKMLGLKEYMAKEEFSRLCHNLHPVTGEKLTPRTKKERRVGYDFNWNCEKSASILYAYTRDERIIQAARQAWREAMDKVETMAATRVRTEGRNEDRPTGNILYAEIIHLTARPEDGIPDPHLHAHCYLFNVTWDDAEKKFKAVQLGDVVEESGFFQGLATRLFEENLNKLGLKTVRTEHGFEIEGFSRELIEKFSTRTEAIEARAKALGITDPDQKGRLGAMTRKSKNKDLTLSDLDQAWWPRLSPEEKEILEGLKGVLQRSRAAEMSRQMAVGSAVVNECSKALGTMDTLPAIKTKEPATSSDHLGKRKEAKGAKARHRQSMNQKTRPGPQASGLVEATEHDRRAVALAAEHLFERESVVTQERLKAEAFKSWCIGKATVRGIEKAVAEAPLLRKERNGRVFVTTAEVLAEEKRIAERCIQGKGKYEAMNPDWKIEDKTLNEEQCNGVMHALRSTDFIVGLEGWAGVGKTRLLNEFRRGAQSGMHKVLAVAPTSEAAREVLRKEGFDNAETVAKLLRSGSLQQEAKGAAILVDEAGLLPMRDTGKLIDLAKKLEARLILVGDPLQHYPVQRGQAFELLRKFGKMEVAKVTKIQRQKGIHRRFVEQVIAEDIPGAMKTLKELEWAFEMTLEERKIALARDYIHAIEHGNTALVVAPTHAECANVTAGIRDALKEKKVLKEGTQWDVLRNLSWTEAQKSDSDHYKNKKGLVVQINDHVKGFALGQQVEVIYEDKCRSESTDDGMVRVRCKNGYDWNIRALPLSEPETFSVHERDKLEICEGELVRITGHGYTAQGHRLYNRKTYKVDYISHDGRIVLENGGIVDRKFKHLDYGYTRTSNSAQGQTVDWVFVAASAEMSSSAVDMRQFYVSMTRGRKGSKLYADDLKWLEENASVRRERPMAMETLAPVMEETRPVEPPKEHGDKAEAELSAKLEKSDALEVMLQESLKEKLEPDREMVMTMM